MKFFGKPEPAEKAIHYVWPPMLRNRPLFKALADQFQFDGPLNRFPLDPKAATTHDDDLPEYFIYALKVCMAIEAKFQISDNGTVAGGLSAEAFDYVKRTTNVLAAQRLGLTKRQY